MEYNDVLRLINVRTLHRVQKAVNISWNRKY